MDMLFSDSDWESFSESSSSESHEDSDFLFGGQARSILSSLEESIGKIDDFLSFERVFMHGDTVCSVTDPSGQMGRVLDVDILVDLENVFGKVLKDVNSKKLRKIRSISVGDYVVCGPWLGRVDKVIDSVTILFDDGAKCEVNTMDLEKLLPISPDLLEDSQYPYYPGQRVQVRVSTLSKSARWLCGNWKESRDEGTVCDVDAGLLYVDWLASSPLCRYLSFPAPPCLQDPKNLTLLSCFSHANWQLGDWCILPIAELRGVVAQIMRNASTFELITKHKKTESGLKKGVSKSVDELFVIVKTKTKVDVLWQDGKLSLGMDSRSLFPIDIVNSHEFWPQQFVVEKGTCDDPHTSSSQRWGVVRSVDAKERTVKVNWKSTNMNQLNDEGDWTEEIVSAYELIEHPDYSYCLGDIVFRSVQYQFVGQADEQTFKDFVKAKTGISEEATLEGKNFGGGQNNLDNGYLSCIGNVTGFKDSGVEVRWATGVTTKVAPYEIFRLDKFEVSASTPVLHGETVETVEESNQETTEHDNQSSHPEGMDLLALNDVGEDIKTYPWDSSSFFHPQTVISFFTGIATYLFTSVGTSSLIGPFSSGHMSESETKYGILHDKVLESCDPSFERLPIVLDELQTGEAKQQVEEVEDKKDLFLSGENPEQFKQFDIVDDCSDHHFLDASGKGLALSQVKSGWLKKVQQEWSILEKNLPDSIYVRIYEERMDLLRAAIIGAPGTPYHDGLFFFDIFLPPDYPHEPPSVHYNSGGLRLNPNLYESGKVCLSLLNTWTGTGTEVWNPGSSTILQILLSLQALVLNEKPYFNEAGYDKQMGQAEGEKNSVSYNENAFLVTCKSMLYILRKPPKHFEALVEEHFSKRSESILMACKSYMEGAPVGCAFGYGETKEESLKECSTGFKIMLAKVLPKLVEAFSDKGIDCSQIY